MNCKKILGVIVSLALVIGGLQIPYNYKTVYADGLEETIIKNVRKESVPEGYKAIYTANDLYAIRSNPSGKYILMNDIDLTEATKQGGSLDHGHGWTPIPEFYGILDGNGYRIVGMNIYGEYRGNIDEVLVVTAGY